MHKIDRLHDVPATVVLYLNASYEYSYVRCVLSVMYFKKTVMFFVFRIIIMSKMFYPSVCFYCCNLVQFAIFWLARMYDECTWYHKTFLVHLATKLYCVIVIFINENNNVEKYTALFHNHCVGHWNCNETTRGKKKTESSKHLLSRNIGTNLSIVLRKDHRLSRVESVKSNISNRVQWT